MASQLISVIGRVQGVGSAGQRNVWRMNYKSLAGLKTSAMDPWPFWHRLIPRRSQHLLRHLNARHRPMLWSRKSKLRRPKHPCGMNLTLPIEK